MEGGDCQPVGVRMSLEEIKEIKKCREEGLRKDTRDCSRLRRNIQGYGSTYSDMQRPSYVRVRLARDDQGDMHSKRYCRTLFLPEISPIPQRK